MPYNATKLTAFTAAMLLLAGCGSDPAEEDTTRPESQDQSEPTAEPAEDTANDAADDATADGPGDAPAPAEVRGVVNVDGVAYDITEVRNCEPYEIDMVEVELELQGIGEHNGERVQIDVYIETIAGEPFDDVSWAGPEGIFGGPDDANVALDAAGSSVRGAATLVDALHQTEQVSIDFDLEVPSETIACR